MKKAKHRNGIRYSLITKERAKALRRDGKTHREIVKELGISLGTADLWVKDVTLSDEQKAAIQERRTVHTFSSREKARAVARLHPYQYKQEYTDEDLIQRINTFFARHHRIPFKREFNALRIYRERFGSWNNAIRRAGFEPNPVLFSKKFIAADGHPCDSFTEKIIDDWFYRHRVSHNRNVHYGRAKMTADFFIGQNIAVEFFGLAHVQKKYDAIIERKRELACQLSWRLIEVYPEDLFPKNRLQEILSFIRI